MQRALSCARSWRPLVGSRGAETRGPVAGRCCGCSVYTSKVARQQQSIATWDLLSDGALRSGGSAKVVQVFFDASAPFFVEGFVG